MRRKRLGDDPGRAPAPADEGAAPSDSAPTDEADARAEQSADQSAEREGLVDWRADLVVSAAPIALGTLLIVESADIREGSIPDPIGSGGMPRLLGGFLIAVGIVLVTRRLLGRRQQDGNLVPSDGGQADEPGFPASSMRAFGLLAAGWGWVFLLTRLGYLIPTALLAGVGMAAMRVRSPWKLVGISVIFSVVTFLLFNRVFGIQFPAGPLEQFGMDHVPRVD